jgi:hypothetical protein
MRGPNRLGVMGRLGPGAEEARGMMRRVPSTSLGFKTFVRDALGDPTAADR